MVARFFKIHDLDEVHGTLALGGEATLGSERRIFAVYVEDERRAVFEIRPLVGDDGTWAHLAVQLKLSSFSADSSQSVVFAAPSILDQVEGQSLEAHGRLFLPGHSKSILTLRICGLSLKFGVEAQFGHGAIIEHLILKLVEIKP